MGHIAQHQRARLLRHQGRAPDGELGEGYDTTVEPGLYFQPVDELIPAELRGIGIRIEDDILVTAEEPRTGRLAGAQFPGAAVY